MIIRAEVLGKPGLVFSQYLPLLEVVPQVLFYAAPQLMSPPAYQQALIVLILQ